MICRICGHQTEAVLDLGESPPANSLLVSPADYSRSFPLVLEHCDRCRNLQLRDCLDAVDLYQNYLYVTPDSPQLHAHYERLCSWLLAGRYVDSQSFVLEVGSNIGLFLRFLQPQVRKVLGIDPAMNICQMATDAGIVLCATSSIRNRRSSFETHMAPQMSSSPGTAPLTTAIQTSSSRVRLAGP